MQSHIVKSTLKRINRPDLLGILAEELSGTELNSLLLEVFNCRTKDVSPPELLNLYQGNRFVAPSDLPVLAMKRMELEVLELLEQNAFKAIDLSPLAILGACSVVGPVDQKKVLTALRGTEVLADSTNSIALHVCDLLQRGASGSEPLRFCNIQRQVRTQAIAFKGFRPHFRIGCLVSSGSDPGNFHFEKTGLQEHIAMMKLLFLNYYKMDGIAFRLLKRDGYPANFLPAVVRHLEEAHPDTAILAVGNPDKPNEYYKGIQYKVDITFKGRTYEIGDGGFVDWTQRLLQNRKHRMLSTGFGFDLMYRILHGEI